MEHGTIALEAIYGDDLRHDDGCADADAVGAAAAEAALATSGSDRSPSSLVVSFSIRLNGGADGASLPMSAMTQTRRPRHRREIRLQVNFGGSSTYPLNGQLPRFSLQTALLSQLPPDGAAALLEAATAAAQRRSAQASPRTRASAPSPPPTPPLLMVGGRALAEAPLQVAKARTARPRSSPAC